MEKNNLDFIFASVTENKEVAKYCEMAEELKLPLVVSISRLDSNNDINVKVFENVQDLKKDVDNLLSIEKEQVNRSNKINSFLDKFDKKSDNIEKPNINKMK